MGNVVQQNDIIGIFGGTLVSNKTALYNSNTRTDSELYNSRIAMDRKFQIDDGILPASLGACCFIVDDNSLVSFANCKANEKRNLFPGTKLKLLNNKLVDYSINCNIKTTASILHVDEFVNTFHRIPPLYILQAATVINAMINTELFTDYGNMLITPSNFLDQFAASQQQESAAQDKYDQEADDETYDSDEQ